MGLRILDSLNAEIQLQQRADFWYVGRRSYLDSGGERHKLLSPLRNRFPESTERSGCRLGRNPQNHKWRSDLAFTVSWIRRQSGILCRLPAGQLDRVGWRS